MDAIREQFTAYWWVAVVLAVAVAAVVIRVRRSRSSDRENR